MGCTELKQNEIQVEVAVCIKKGQFFSEWIYRLVSPTTDPQHLPTKPHITCDLGGPGRVWKSEVP